jgi:hypothetical protein
MNDGPGIALKMRHPAARLLGRGGPKVGGPDPTASGVCMRTAGGVAPKPGAARSCHDRMPVESSKGRASSGGLRGGGAPRHRPSPLFVIRE